MGWEKQVQPPHDCVLPKKNEIPDDHGTGSVWRCDECNQRWVLDSAAGPNWHSAPSARRGH